MGGRASSGTGGALARYSSVMECVLQNSWASSSVMPSGSWSYDVSGISSRFVIGLPFGRSAARRIGVTGSHHAHDASITLEEDREQSTVPGPSGDADPTTVGGNADSVA